MYRRLRQKKCNAKRSALPLTRKGFCRRAIQDQRGRDEAGVSDDGFARRKFLRLSAVGKIGGGRLKRLNSFAAGLIAVAAISRLSCDEASAQGVTTEDSLVLFEDLVRNPDDVKTNLAYA